MSSENTAPRTARMGEYLQAWTDSIARVLQDVAGTPHTSDELSAEAASTQREALQADGVCALFEASQHLAGEQAFVLSKGDAVRLAQLLLAEPPDPNVPMSDDHRDALGELFRQFAGAAAAALKGLAGGEVSFKWSGLECPHFEPVVRAGLQWANAKSPPFSMIVEISPALAAALDPATSPTAPAEPLPASGLVRDPKLELLMDVELDVTLRFGERQMTLRSILDLNAGSVVELDRSVAEPVELLVGGKVVAQGEVVIVDGNYGLRVTQIVSPVERIESLRR